MQGLFCGLKPAINRRDGGSMATRAGANPWRGWGRLSNAHPCDAYDPRPNPLAFPPSRMGHRRQPDLEAGTGHAEPAHSAYAIELLAWAEHLLDPGAYPAHLGVVRLQARERLRDAADARVHDPRRPPASPDGCLGPATRRGAAAIDVARLGRSPPAPKLPLKLGSSGFSTQSANSGLQRRRQTWRLGCRPRRSPRSLR
jgi:hypothetical protein